MLLASLAKVFLLLCNWGFEDAMTKMMMQAYKSFMVEIRIYGNIFSADDKRTQCPHNGQVEMFRQSTEAVVDCLVTVHADPELINLVDEYLTAQGRLMMAACLTSPHSKFSLLVTSRGP